MESVDGTRFLVTGTLSPTHRYVSVENYLELRRAYSRVLLENQRLKHLLYHGALSRKIKRLRGEVDKQRLAIMRWKSVLRDVFRAQ